ncbi:bacterial regulatory helix-turn-helix, lysR family protein [Sinorhizobium sp. RAC02]|nr:bacterial regulatory helix-turn-helix, lysR family protein [Sinorhizobium sp. RAC02]
MDRDQLSPVKGAGLMNIKQLEVLRTLLATGSTIATAKAMGLSQSGVSRLLAQLESDLALTLFARDKGRLIPTPEATILARDAENVLLAVDRMSGHAEDLRNGASGPETVRIGLPSSMWENFAPAMLIDYVRAFPGVRIETFFESTTAINKLVEERTIDLGFLRMEGEVGPGIVVDRVASGQSVCVIPEGHPLAELEEVTAKHLRNVPLILIGRQRPNRMALDQAFKRAGVKQLVKIETHTNSSACSYVAHGLGVTIISSFYANLYRHLPVVHRPFVPRSTQEFGLARADGVPLSIAAQALSDALKRQIQFSQNSK